MNVKGKTSGELNGFLDAGSHIQGELHFEETFRIDGKVTGKVISQGDLVVGEKGEIEGEIRVGRVFVAGEVRGQITASRRIEIGPGGRVLADLETPALVVEEGAFYEGQCAMARPAKASAEPASGPKVIARLPAAKG